MKAHLLVFVVVGLAFGQDDKTSSSVGNASLLKPESAEHKFAVKKLAEATAAFNEIVRSLDALKGKGAYRAEDTLLNRMGVAEREVYDAKQRVARADECVQVYAMTIDKKTSDLTQREVDAVGGCKSLSLSTHHPKAHHGVAEQALSLRTPARPIQTQKSRLGILPLAATMSPG